MKISIITVCYNSGATIASTLTSVAGQTHKDIEHLVIDGKSDDSTPSVVRDCLNQNLIFSSEPDDGIYDAMNKGIRRSSGQVIGILNADDFYAHDNVLHEVVSAFSSDPSLDVVFGDVDFVDSANLDRSVRKYRAFAFRGWMFRFGFMPPHPAVFVRKTAYDRVGVYKTDYKIAADFDFLLRLLFIDGAKYRATGRHWVRMRLGGASTAGLRSTLVITQEMRRSLRENGIFSSFLLLLFRLPIKFFGQSPR